MINDIFDNNISSVDTGNDLASHKRFPSREIIECVHIVVCATKRQTIIRKSVSVSLPI